MISIIIPCYNQAAFLPETLNSILMSTYTNWECILVNDGSTDDSPGIIAAVLNKSPKFKAVEKENGGLSSARNAGLKRAKGDYIQFLDADDLLAPNKFELQLAALNNCKRKTIAISDYFPFNDLTGDLELNRYMSPFLNPENFKSEIISEWEIRKSIPCHSFLIPKNLISDNNLQFDENLPNHEDWVFWCQLFYYADNIVYQSEKLAKYRIRQSSMSADYHLMRTGFLAACNSLKVFYDALNNPLLKKAVYQKEQEIKSIYFSDQLSPSKLLLQRIKNSVRSLIPR